MVGSFATEDAPALCFVPSDVGKRDRNIVALLFSRARVR